MAKRQKKTEAPPETPSEATWAAPYTFTATLSWNERAFDYTFRPNITYTIVEDADADHAADATTKKLARSAYEVALAHLTD